MNRPKDGFLRLKQIIPDLIPIGKSSWWAGIKRGLYPKGTLLGPHTRVWRASEIYALIDKLNDKTGPKDDTSKK